MDLELKNKVALITGGSKGIGLAIASGLAREGVHIVICARNEANLEAAASFLKKNHEVDVLALPADVSRMEDIQLLTDKAIDFKGHVDILINNAGTGTNETIENSKDEDWYHYWDLHVMSAIRLSRLMLSHMRKLGGGVMLNNASICATQPMEHEPIYNTTKAALSMFSKCLANEAIRYNIRVNTINPGLIRTEAWENAAENAVGAAGNPESFLEKIARENTPIGRFASTQELADFFVFLCSPRASYSVGSTYYVDGGWLKTVV
jgi:NAD(P)-dependent dehydrogenase (short-subunit alcohol dehydrogenase family)